MASIGGQSVQRRQQPRFAQLAGRLHHGGGRMRRQMPQQGGAERVQPVHAHVDHQRGAGLGDQGRPVGLAVVLRVGGDESDAAAMLAMGQGNTQRGGRGETGTDA